MDETRCHEPLQRQIPSTSITQHLVSTFSLLAVQQSVMTQFTESYESQPKATQTRGTLDSILGFWCGANKFEHLTHSLRTILCSLWVAQIVRISIIHVQHKDSSLVITLSCAREGLFQPSCWLQSNFADCLLVCLISPSTRLNCKFQRFLGSHGTVCDARS